ncbi:hypothetical protein NUU61_004908 [Penicillium alfredii]|uniref:Peroxin/Ferlin domain-containing protein n=1 Tax=Penicillium alfredii TaxID=1506179 RepID=A0A9W9K819_9EURO|nr:uncharacterized protein NUU61_004908 [Penicillium alfredii]KAJ5095552.1 hypothetical protein NUU61_004908 [Penicillium alfredii]
MDSPASISLVDNTVPSQQPAEEPFRRVSTIDRQGSLSKHLSRASVQSQLAKRKYAKWQPDRLGVPADPSTSLSRDSSRVRGSISATSSDGRSTQQGIEERDRDTGATDPSLSRVASDNGNTAARSTNPKRPANGSDDTTLLTELDILYENQRGWFFFGVPLYSHGSLLNFDPSAWMTQDKRASPVNITNAQVPDPSWEWAWRTWYVDMSGDVDEQGWQYSFSFASSEWHGTHPWFHSFVRRRRWVRLRTKAPERRLRGRSGFEKAHMLTKDYFTIHSSRVRSREQSTVGLSRVESGFLNRMSQKVDEEAPLEEIGDIPALMFALKHTSIDREKIDALRKFVREGGDELYYLDERIPDVMSMFLFQASRWQFVTYLVGVIHELSEVASESDGKNADAMQRKKDNLVRAVETARRHVTGPDVFSDSHGESVTALLDLTPVSQHDALLSRRPGSTPEQPSMQKWKGIKGIPQAAERAKTLPNSDNEKKYHPLSPSSPLLPPSPVLIHASDAVAASSSMFSCGRPCLRRRLSAVLDTVAAGPDEPLLFLYPRWAAPALRQRRQITSLKSTTAPSGTCQTPDLPFPAAARPCASLPFRSSNRWMSSGATGHSPSITQLHSPREAKVGFQFEGDINEGGIETSGYDAGDSSVTGHNQSEGSSVDDPLSVVERRRTARRENRRPEDTEHESPSRKNSVQKMSVPDRKKLRYREFQAKREFQTQRGPGRSKQNCNETWRDMQSLLESVQKDPRNGSKKPSKYKEMHVPEETVALLAGVTDMTMNENIWQVPIHNGCRVHVLDAQQGDGRNRKVILSGSERVVEVVADRIMRAQNLQSVGDPLVEIGKSPVPVYGSLTAMARRNIPAPVIRGVWNWSDDWANPMRLENVLAARPPLTSVRGFNEYVEDLVSAGKLKYQLKARDRTDDNNSRTHTTPHTHQDIARQLVALFKQDVNHKYFSTAAMNHALAFLCDHELLQAARTVFLLAEHLATTDTYNILLRCAARRQDIKGFRGLLYSMSRAHFRPNAHTWLSLLSALVTPSDKAKLITHMARNGYISEINTIRSVLQQTIHDSLLVHLESGQDIDSFIHLMTNTWGANWLSSSLISQMFNVTVRLKDFSATDRLMRICMEHGLAVDSTSLTHILRLFRADIFSALKYTFQFMNRPLFRLAPETWEKLFLVAYKGRHYNICRVLWRYACMGNAVSYKMKQSVLSSLTRNTPRKKGSDISTIWSLSAGKVIVGLDLHHETYTIKDSILEGLPAEFRDKPLLYLSSGFMPQGENRDRQLRLAADLVLRDVELGASQYKPMHSLPIMLEAAALLDLEWHGKPWPLPWMMQNAIQVPIIPR